MLNTTSEGSKHLDLHILMMAALISQTAFETGSRWLWFRFISHGRATLVGVPLPTFDTPR